MTHINHNKDAITDKPLILLTGATGYVGGRLLKVLEGVEKVPSQISEVF